MLDQENRLTAVVRVPIIQALPRGLALSILVDERRLVGITHKHNAPHPLPHSDIGVAWQRVVLHGHVTTYWGRVAPGDECAGLR